MRWLNRNPTVGLVVRLDLDGGDDPASGRRSRDLERPAPGGVRSSTPEPQAPGHLARALAERYGERHLDDLPPPHKTPVAADTRREPPSTEPMWHPEEKAPAPIVARVAETVEAGFAQPAAVPAAAASEPKPRTAPAPVDPARTVAPRLPTKRRASAESPPAPAARPQGPRRSWEPPDGDPRALWQVIRERRASGAKQQLPPASPLPRPPTRRPAGGRSLRTQTSRRRSARPGAGRVREAVAVVLLVGVLAAVGSFAYVTSNGGRGTLGVAVVPPPARLVLSAPTSASAGAPFSVTVSAVNRHGALVQAFGGTVRFTTTYRAPGVELPAQYTFRPGDHGVHRFVDAVRLVTAGSQVLTAVDPGRTVVGGASTPIRVDAAAATRLALSVPPSATTGSPFGVTVTALDRFGNVATGFRGPVSISTGNRPTQGAPAPTYTFGGGDGGVHTFSVVVPLVGGRALSATDSADRSIRGRSAAVQVTEAAAVRFVVSAPASATAGMPFSVTVTAQGRTGTVATGYTGTVHFTTTDAASGVSLPANFAFGRSDRGMHTFSGGVTLVSGGPQRLTVTDTSERGLAGTSTAVDVVLQSAARLVITAPPTVTAGARLSVTVTARTRSGGIAAGFSGTVQLSATDRAKGVKLPADFTFSSVDGGVHTFRRAVRLVTAGTEGVTVSDANSGAVSGTSAIVEVTPAHRRTDSANG